jgi:tetratricopeptide (TPR) repeat protein
MLGEAYFKQGKWKEAEKWYVSALKAKQDHVPAHLTYGKLLAKLVNTLITEWINQILKIRPMGNSLPISVNLIKCCRF